ncbi:MAG: hypothetical protein WC565_07245 [Parcubacteria group bacterium]|jgi:hypothetical protein
MRVLVKGTSREAETAALERGMYLQVAREIVRLPYSETVGEVSDIFQPELARWYTEDVGRVPPYPVGSLLMYWSADHAE